MRAMLPLVMATALLSAAPVHAVPLKTFSEPQVGFEIAVPQACRHVVAFGTIEAVCAPGFDAVRAHSLPAAGAWLFEIDYEVAPKDAQPYALKDFAAETPQMVCGGDNETVKLSDVRETGDQGSAIFTARVTCPALPFLGLPERTAAARVVIAGGKRFRLIARTPTADVERVAPAAAAFFASFKLTAP